MKLDLSITEAAAILLDDEYASWTYRGAVALVEFIEDVEGEDSDLDAVALRCEFSEYDSLLDWAECYWGTVNKVCQASIEFDWNEDTNEQEKEEQLREYLSENTILIEFEGGIIVSDF